MEADSGRHELLNTFNRFAIGLVLLIVLRFVVLALPMVRDLGFLITSGHDPYWAGLTWALLIDVALRTWMIYLILSFGTRVRELLPQIRPELPQLGTMVYLAAAFAAVLIGYFAYDDLVVPPLKTAAWIYMLAFALAAIGSLSWLTFLIYQNSDQILKAVRTLRTGQTTSSTVSPPVLTSAEQLIQCPKCGVSLQSDARSAVTTANISPAASSESKTEKTEPAQTVPQTQIKQPTEPPKCAQCGAPLKSSDRFCRRCGAQRNT